MSLIIHVESFPCVLLVRSCADREDVDGPVAEDNMLEATLKHITGYEDVLNL